MEKKTLGILQAGHSPEAVLERYPDYHQLFVELLGEHAFNYQHWVVLDNEFPDSAQDADAWLITGSRHGAYEPHDWIPPLEALIRQIYAQGTPLVGICFGHQIIAQALGGRVEKFTGGWSVGRVEYQLEPSVFGNTTPSTSLLAFHQDQVTEPPPEARTVGHSGFCRYAALAYDTRILTIQPHPEFDADFVASLLDARSDILPPAIAKQATDTLELPLDRHTVAQSLRDFLNGTHALQSAYQPPTGNSPTA